MIKNAGYSNYGATLFMSHDYFRYKLYVVIMRSMGYGLRFLSFHYSL